MDKQTMQELNILRRKLLRYRIITILCLCITLSLVTIETIRWIRANALELGLINIEEEAPFYRQVKEIMEPLRYSGLKDFFDPDTRLSIEFEDKRWTLHNIHHFDKDGRVLLKEDRFGLCGDLAAYIYERITPFLNNTYSIDFLRAAESSFFPLPKGSHIVLKITDNSFSLIPRVYILDPSFRKYKRIEYFDEYILLSAGIARNDLEVTIG